MSAHEIPVNEQVDVALDDIQRERERVTVRPDSCWRSTRLAELAEMEACWWAVLFEHARIRVHWRAALVAHEAARRSAKAWRRRAANQRDRGPASAGRVLARAA